MNAVSVVVDEFLYYMKTKYGMGVATGDKEVVEFFAVREVEMKRKMRLLEERVQDLERRKK